MMELITFKPLGGNTIKNVAREIRGLTRGKGVKSGYTEKTRRWIRGRTMRTKRKPGINKSTKLKLIENSGDTERGNQRMMSELLVEENIV